MIIFALPEVFLLREQRTEKGLRKLQRKKKNKTLSTVKTACPLYPKLNCVGVSSSKKSSALGTACSRLGKILVKTQKTTEQCCFED